MNDTLREGSIEAYQFRILIESTRKQRDDWLEIVTKRGYGYSELHESAIRLRFLEVIEIGYFHYPAGK